MKHPIMTQRSELEINFTDTQNENIDNTRPDLELSNNHTPQNEENGTDGNNGCCTYTTD